LAYGLSFDNLDSLEVKYTNLEISNHLTKLRTI